MDEVIRNRAEIRRQRSLEEGRKRYLLCMVEEMLDGVVEHKRRETAHEMSSSLVKELETETVGEGCQSQVAKVKLILEIKERKVRLREISNLSTYTGGTILSGKW